MSKHTISISVNAAEKRYITRDLIDAIEGHIQDELGLPHNTGLDKKTTKLVEAAAAKMYEPYLKRLIKHVTQDIDLSGDSVDLVWDLANTGTAAEKIANRLDVRTRAAAVCEANDLGKLTRMAARLGYTLVPEDE